jgi:hypothetical protein
LFDKDYKPPPIPKSYWVNRGFDEAYAKEMEGFLSKMKVISFSWRVGILFNMMNLFHFVGGRKLYCSMTTF